MREIVGVMTMQLINYQNELDQNVKLALETHLKQFAVYNRAEIEVIFNGLVSSGKISAAEIPHLQLLLG